MERRFKSCVKYLAFFSYLKLSIRFCISTIEITKNVGYLVWAKFADYFLQNEIVLMSISNVTDCAPFSPHLLHEVRWLWQKELQKTGTLDFFLSTYSSGNQTLPKKSKSKTKKTAILFVSIVNSQKCTTTNIVEKSTCICTNVIYSTL